MKNTIFLAVLAAFWLAGCAQVGQLNGGERDSVGPVVDTARSSAFLQTNFVQKPIELTFNEWVKLDKPETQIVVSPPLNYPPVAKIKGHSVVLTFDKRDTLRPNVTYTVNFGNAVKDLTEGNPALDLRYVFSTGPSIDSLGVTAVIADATTGKATEDIFVMLYEDTSDSVVRKSRPFYFGKTNKDGIANIRNIRAGTYRVFALKDANADYLYNNETELIGFPDGLVTVTDSTSPAKLKFSMGLGYRTLRRLDSDMKTYGLFKILFNRPPTDAIVRTDIGGAAWHETDGDTLKLWYEAVDSFRLYVSTDRTADTFWVKPPAKNTWLEKARFGLPILKLPPNAIKPAPVTAAQHPDEALKLTFVHPIGQIFSDKWQLLEDTTLTPVQAQYLADSANRKTLLVVYPWKEDKVYSLLALPGSLTDLYGLPNDDTVRQSLKITPRKMLGEVLMKLSNLDSTHTYFVELLLSEQVTKSMTIREKSSLEVTFAGLPLGAYTIRVTDDLNQNKRADGPDYDRKAQPERVLLKKLETLRANWTQEAIIDWSGDAASGKAEKSKKL